MAKLGTVLREGWGWLLANKEWVFSGVGVALLVGLLGWWFSEPTPAPAEESTLQGSVAIDGDMTGSAAVTGDHNVVTVTRIEGVAPETHQALAKQFGVTEGALTSFFKILERVQVPSEELDSTLREIATRYRELDQKLATFTSEDPAVVTLKKAARAALEAGEFERTEVHLKEAKEKDLEAAKGMYEVAHKRFLSAAESAAELGALNLESSVDVLTLQ
jgi:hypothetical protein